MLATNKISDAFAAIVEEAEKLYKKETDEKKLKKLATIISIAKHQSDIRDAKPGSCTGKHESKESCCGDKKKHHKKKHGGGCCSTGKKKQKK